MLTVPKLGSYFQCLQVFLPRCHQPSCPGRYPTTRMGPSIYKETIQCVLAPNSVGTLVPSPAPTQLTRWNTPVRRSRPLPPLADHIGISVRDPRGELLLLRFFEGVCKFVLLLWCFTVGDGISSDRHPILQGTAVDSSYRCAAEIRCVLLQLMFLSTLSTGSQVCYHYRAELVFRPLHAFIMEQRQTAITCYYIKSEFQSFHVFDWCVVHYLRRAMQKGIPCTSNLHTSLLKAVG